tara:strand:- start:456 stop:926 length:471 start_codon:yes stop_codon:yes gene_type:complete
MKLKTAVFPGSFDPLTLGHIDIINRSLKLFDKLIIAIGTNPEKKYMFTLKQRKEFITSIFKKEKQIVIKDYASLTVNFCKEQKSNYIVRGLRNYSDFEYEKDIALTNNKLNNGIETIFFLTSQEHMMTSSSIVKDIIKNNGDLTLFLHHSTISTIE